MQALWSRDIPLASAVHPCDGSKLEQHEKIKQVIINPVVPGQFFFRTEQVACIRTG